VLGQIDGGRTVRKQKQCGGSYGQESVHFSADNKPKIVLSQ
jgi:hypothetical protein